MLFCTRNDYRTAAALLLKGIVRHSIAVVINKNLMNSCGMNLTTMLDIYSRSRVLLGWSARWGKVEWRC